METYYFTFGQAHTHPETGERMKDYWVEIETDSYYAAHEEMYKLFGQMWANVYNKQNFNNEFFPKGCYAKYKIEL